MHKSFSLLIVLCFSTFLFAQKPTDNFSGKWKTIDGVIIDIAKTNASFNGKPIGKNVYVLKDLTYTDGKWVGVLSNPQKNTTANCEAYLQGNKIKFIAKAGMMKKEIFWTKAN